MRQGLRLFLALTAVGLVFVLYRSSFSGSIKSLSVFRWQYLVLALALVLLDWVLAGLRIYVFAVRLRPGISFTGCVRAGLANIFMGGVTPSQTGGGPGQIFVLYKEGMPVFNAMVVSFLGAFLGTVLFLPLCSLLFLVLFDPVAVDFRLHYLLLGSLAVFIFLIALAAAGLVDPALVKRAVRSAAAAVPPLKRVLERKGYLDAADRLVDRYNSMMRFFLAEGKSAFAIGFILSAAIYINKFTIAWVVLRGMGIAAPYTEVIYTQLVLIMIFYFAPSPGAAGLAEISAAEVMKGIVPAASAGAYVLLWRLFTLLIGLCAGALVMVRYFYRGRMEEEARDTGNSSN
ncbi:MAG TPA: flippase-like domain-containing protein [Candidatus Eisenbacteria bacterium]|uniref:Flippase-like domain-containing protein n=1 Tax=Eiseniibacteriota bacterium TaxID=2212470 RepID=A0A7V2F3L1_UNCEI|nr:flippase-like domain-containing protein [Candidatus Eisenbacteria bacterium]